jgi:hypothetical protein
MTREHIVNYIQVILRPKLFDVLSVSHVALQANYIAPRIVVVGAGAVNHEQFVDQVARIVFWFFGFESFHYPWNTAGVEGVCWCCDGTIGSSRDH